MDFYYSERSENIFMDIKQYTYFVVCFPPPRINDAYKRACVSGWFHLPENDK